MVSKLLCSHPPAVLPAAMYRFNVFHSFNNAQINKSFWNTSRSLRLGVLLSLVMTLQVSAGCFSQTITLDVKDLPVGKLFAELSKQSGYKFFFNTKLIAGAHNITVKLVKVDFTEALETCFSTQPFTYVIVGKTVVIRKKEVYHVRQIKEAPEVSTSLKVSGRIIDEHGQPVPGATVIVKGSEMGKLTDQNGAFVFDVIDENALLVVSGINIARAYEVPLKGRSDLQIEVNRKITEQPE